MSFSSFVKYSQLTFFFSPFHLEKIKINKKAECQGKWVAEGFRDGHRIGGRLGQERTAVFLLLDTKLYPHSLLAVKYFTDVKHSRKIPMPCSVLTASTLCRRIAAFQGTDRDGLCSSSTFLLFSNTPFFLQLTVFTLNIPTKALFSLYWGNCFAF